MFPDFSAEIAQSFADLQLLILQKVLIVCGIGLIVLALFTIIMAKIVTIIVLRTIDNHKKKRTATYEFRR